MKNTETVTTLSDETFQLTPLRFYACLALYLFAFFFKAQVLALFWGAFLLALLSDLSKQPSPKWSNHPPIVPYCAVRLADLRLCLGTGRCRQSGLPIVNALSVVNAPAEDHRGAALEAIQTHQFDRTHCDDYHTLHTRCHHSHLKGNSYDT